ncbi:GNAT family N-acetyltransferase [Methylobacterium oryzihabitans]|uniref:GNAT family N-acetyltransferase n=1 Tax=Methylobacterium oryzihabitans TaxID=2499852 RepID=A0A3S2XKN6_9HYPH|nr:GNAT family N-acetyltransferase [Methylobacterium oryzihabitans]RVU17146.1 GNAT family N-acetyltransferase [Methylobacterium oryzihabitans]
MLPLPAPWRPMRAADLPGVQRLAGLIHPAYPEDPAVFAERLRLCPEGCRVLDGADGPAGYLVSHPWHARTVPDLDTLVGALPARPGGWCLHDLALLPEARGTGAAAGAVEAVLALARGRGVPEAILVAVGAAGPFWQRRGFRAIEDPAPAGYGTGARLMVRPLTRPATPPPSGRA